MADRAPSPALTTSSADAAGLALAAFALAEVALLAHLSTGCASFDEVRRGLAAKIKGINASAGDPAQIAVARKRLKEVLAYLERLAEQADAGA
jgi:hypothetical protein